MKSIICFFHFFDRAVFKKPDFSEKTRFLTGQTKNFFFKQLVRLRHEIMPERRNIS